MGKAARQVSRHEAGPLVSDPDTGLVFEQPQVPWSRLKPLLKLSPLERRGLYARPGADNTRMRMQKEFLDVLAAERPDTVRALAKILPTVNGWPLSAPVELSIRDWIARYRLEADDSSDWVFVAADLTLREWREQEIRQRWVEWPPRFHPPLGFIDPTVQPMPFTPAFRGWEGDRQPWEEWADEATAEYHQALLAYHDKVARDLVAQGCTLVSARDNRTHYSWLVRYQLGDETYYRLGSASGERDGVFDADVTTVEEGIKKTAGRIGLRLRQPAKRGWPTKHPPVAPF